MRICFCTHDHVLFFIYMSRHFSVEVSVLPLFPPSSFPLRSFASSQWTVTFVSFTMLPSANLIFGFCSCFALIGCAPKTPPKPPAARWCITGHNPPNAAQSGCNGYCRLCFGELFPEEHAAKKLRRLKKCGKCRELQELTPEGICRHCRNARQCERCDAVNKDYEAVVCMTCYTRRTMLGAT